MTPASRIDDALLGPVRRDPKAGRGYSILARSSTGEDLADLRHPWCGFRAPDEEEPGRLDKAVYGGLHMNHFGHFLLEAMSRLWFLRAHPGATVLWHSLDLPVPHAPWPGRMAELARLLGLGDYRNVSIKGPLRVGELVVPPHGYRPGAALDPEQARALRVVKPLPRAIDRLWLSRSALPDQFGRLLGEADLEAKLAERGWTIFHPERHPVAEQARTLARANAVAGFAGSAFHAILLLEEPPARITLVERPAITMGDYAITLPQARIVRTALASLDPRGAWTSYRIEDGPALLDLVERSAEGAA